MAAGLIAGALAFGVACRYASGAPPAGADPGSALSQWFRGLMQPGTGTSCCSEADCRVVKAYRQTDEGWEIIPLDGNKWLPVPPDKILPRTDNPLGEPIACTIGDIVLCFIEPSGA